MKKFFLLLLFIFISKFTIITGSEIINTSDELKALTHAGSFIAFIKHIYIKSDLNYLIILDIKRGIEVCSPNDTTKVLITDKTKKNAYLVLKLNYDNNNMTRYKRDMYNLILAAIILDKRIKFRLNSGHNLEGYNGFSYITGPWD